MSDVLLGRLRQLENQLAQYRKQEFTSGSSLVVTEGPGIDLVGTQVGIGGDTILVYHADLSPAAEFATSGAGLTAALAACTSGDVVLLPVCDLTVDVTVPAGVTLKGLDRMVSQLTGAVTLGAGSKVADVGITGVTGGGAYELQYLTFNSGGGTWTDTTPYMNGTEIHYAGSNLGYVIWDLPGVLQAGFSVEELYAGSMFTAMIFYLNGVEVWRHDVGGTMSIGYDCDQIKMQTWPAASSSYNFRILGSLVSVASPAVIGPGSGTGYVDNCILSQPGGIVVHKLGGALDLKDSDIDGTIDAGVELIDNRISDVNGTPLAGDRAAFDADGYASLHTNDTDTATGIHHTLGTGAAQAAAGDHTHTAETPNVGDISYNPGPIITTIAPAGFITTDPNPIGWKFGAISSVALDGIIWQVYAYYDASGYVTIAIRKVPGEWSLYTTANQFVGGGDGHNFISVGLDADGYIHIAYDHHGSPLHYRKSTLPIDQFAGTLTTTLPMLGTNEDYITYPGFFNDPAGELYFMFRHDTGPIPHQYGDTYFYKYNHTASTWAAATGTGTAGLLVDGTTDTDLAYHLAPAFDADFGTGGKMHFFFTILVNGTAYSNLFFMAWDGTSWTKITGAAQTIPARTSNSTAADALSGDSAQPSVLGQMAYSDGAGHPHIAYFREDGDSVYHLYHLWHNGTAWIKREMVETDTVADTTTGIWTALAIDRLSGTAIIVYTNHGEGDTKIRTLTSKPGDFTSWHVAVIYDAETDLTGYGTYQPKFDPVEWERAGRLCIPVEQWNTSGTNPIYLLEYIPSGWALWDAESHADLHANDTDTAAGIHHTLGTGSTQAAAGNHAHAGLHDPVTVTDTATIDLTLTGQALSADVITAALPRYEIAQDDDGAILQDDTGAIIYVEAI